jgi:hypothetical protein
VSVRLLRDIIHAGQPIPAGTLLPDDTEGDEPKLQVDLAPVINRRPRLIDLDGLVARGDAEAIEPEPVEEPSSEAAAPEPQPAPEPPKPAPSAPKRPKRRG